MITSYKTMALSPQKNTHTIKFISNQMASKRRVPVIDMGDAQTQPEKLVAACEEFGCFRVKNHGIRSSLMTEMKAVVRTLLELPLELKMRNLNSNEPSKGYTPPNMASAFFDSLSLYDMASPAAVHHFCDQMDATPHQR